MGDIDRVLSDLAASDWLKTALRGALKRDPVDAAADAEYLAELLGERCDAVLRPGHERSGKS